LLGLDAGTIDIKAEAGCMAMGRRLKRDHLGTVRLEVWGSEQVVARKLDGVRFWLRPLARMLVRREAAALARLVGEPGVPSLLAADRDGLVRSYLSGQVMFVARPRARAYFRSALRLVRRIHRRGVAHNDLAKEANWLCLADGSAGIVDFQIAVVRTGRGRLFRLLAREDLRHLCKHKQHYLPNALTAREKRLLATPSVVARAWRAVVKPVYHAFTRDVLGWRNRTGPEEREHLYD
jgi:RIO-like serine/threonine protein kinase